MIDVLRLVRSFCVFFIAAMVLIPFYKSLKHSSTIIRIIIGKSQISLKLIRSTMFKIPVAVVGEWSFYVV